MSDQVERVARAMCWHGEQRWREQYGQKSCQCADGCQQIGMGVVDLDEARAAIAAMPEPWQPIETAPKSTHTGSAVQGIYLLGYCPEEGATPASCISVIWWEPLLNGGEWFAEGAMGVKPTHWQPLPPPPSPGNAPSATPEGDKP